jgi:hypothetical protein
MFPGGGILPGGLTSTFNQTRLLLKNVSTLDLLNVQGFLNNSSASQFGRVTAQFYRVEECLELALRYEKEHNMEFQVMRSIPDLVCFSNFFLSNLDLDRVSVTAQTILFSRSTNMTQQMFCGITGCLLWKTKNCDPREANSPGPAMVCSDWRSSCRRSTKVHARPAILKAMYRFQLLGHVRSVSGSEFL